MTRNAIKTCPRCGATFECTLNNPSHCGCASVELREDVLLAIARRYTDCLCVACLREMEAGAPPPTGQSPL